MRTATKLICILSLFSFLCLLRFDDIHGQDELSHYMKLARLLYTEWYTHPQNLITFSPHLYPFSLWGVAELLGGMNSFSMRLTGVLYWLALLGCLYGLARRTAPTLLLWLCVSVPVSVAAAVIVEIDQTAMPFFTLLMVWTVHSWTEHDRLWRLVLVALAFCLGLWCRCTTPLVLVPLFLCYVWSRTESLRRTAWLATALAIGGVAFFASWYVYGRLTGIYWQGVFAYLARSFGETTTGTRSSGVSRLGQSLLSAMFWGMPVAFLVLACCAVLHHLRAMRGGSGNHRFHLSEPCLYLLSGLWLWCGYAVVGGSLFGFPKYQTGAYPLIFLGIVLHGCRHWNWQAAMTSHRRVLWLTGAGLFILAFIVRGDPLYLMRIDLRMAQLEGHGVMGTAARLLAFPALATGLAGAVLWCVQRRWKTSTTLLILTAGIAFNAALLFRQTIGGYSCGYVYGDEGDTRQVARYINDHGIDPSQALVPHEVLGALETPELTYPYPFMLEDQDGLRRRIMETRPPFIALSPLVYPVPKLLEYMNDAVLGDVLREHYACRSIGRYQVWERISPVQPKGDPSCR